MAKTTGGNSLSTVRPGRLLTAAAIAIPNTLTPPNPDVFPGGTHLVDENRLPKVLDELDDRSRVLLFIEDPSRLPFPHQRMRPFFDILQGSTDDWLR